VRLELNLAEANACLLLPLLWALDEGTVSHGCKGRLAGRDSSGLGVCVPTGSPRAGASQPVKSRQYISG